MPIAYLTRRVFFAAAHRYRRPEWSDEKNREVFGPCAWPNFHGHSYSCDVTVSGPIDETTGFVADLGELDRILASEITQRFDHRNINLDIPEFAEGALIPTGENLARFIFARLRAALPERIDIVDVTIGEDETLSASCRPDR